MCTIVALLHMLRRTRRGLDTQGYARLMPQTDQMIADEVASYITSTFPDTKVAQAMGATFFSLTDNSWPNFATIVTTDEHDVGAPSEPDSPRCLSPEHRCRPGSFRPSPAGPAPALSTPSSTSHAPSHIRQAALGGHHQPDAPDLLRPAHAATRRAHRKLARTLRRSPAG